MLQVTDNASPSTTLSKVWRDQVLSLDTQSSMVLQGEKASWVTVKVCADIPPTSAQVFVSHKITLADEESELLQAEATILLSWLAAQQNNS